VGADGGGAGHGAAFNRAVGLELGLALGSWEWELFDFSSPFSLAGTCWHLL
jgi:hypothetical protein